MSDKDATESAVSTNIKLYSSLGADQAAGTLRLKKVAGC